MTTNGMNTWHAKILDNLYALLKKWDMPEDISGEISGFVLTIAREQYKTGNSSGIAWARNNPPRSAAATA